MREEKEEIEERGFWDTEDQKTHGQVYAKARGLDLEDDVVRDFVKKQMWDQGYRAAESLKSKKKKRERYRYRIFEIFAVFYMYTLLLFKTSNITWLFWLIVIGSVFVAILLFRDLYKTLVQLNTLKKDIKYHSIYHPNGKIGGR